MAGDLVVAQKVLPASYSEKLTQAQQAYILHRLWSSLKMEDSGCWEWTKSLGNSGYGKMRVGHSKDYQSHRLSYWLFKGPIPVGKCILHTCDNRKCVNPDHLFCGTHKENTADMIKKGRYVPPMSLRSHCPSGHVYDSVNSNGSRICTVCMKNHSRRSYEKNKNKGGFENV